MNPNYSLLQEAYTLIEGIPDEKFDLDEVQNRCGTVACAAGWIALS